MKIGTVVRNMYQPNYESLLVYRGIQGNYANVVWILNGSVKYNRKFYKRDILNDREHFPIVGYVDLDELILYAVRNAVE